MTTIAVIAVLAAACLVVSLAVRLGAQRVLEEKARQGQLCLEALDRARELDGGARAGRPAVVFSASPRRLGQFLAACFRDNPFRKYRAVLCFIRLRGVVRLFRREKVLQTPAAAAALASCRAAASEIGSLRGMEGGNAEVSCDVAVAGLQAIRLYMACSYDEAFSRQRFDSCFRVNNAFNGSFYKYRTADGRHFSFHVYYASQKAKMVKALGLPRDPDSFSMESSKVDRGLLGSVVAKLKAADLEELAFSSGACGCMLRNRREWEESPVGKAVTAMPLVKVAKVAPAGATGEVAVRKCPAPDPARGPLSGIKVLDLTHIIAGPACTRLLAEYGADVLLVRRGGFGGQEQSFLEFDGWAGKRSIQLDFNVASGLARAKELVREADIVISSYQQGALDRFGLGEAGIRALNPGVIYGKLLCFSDTVWETRPGWAPLAEDITGLSIRNGSQEKPRNLNGVPLDYIPGFVFCLGILDALKRSMVEGGAYTVTASLTRTASWLHELSDLWLAGQGGAARRGKAAPRGAAASADGCRSRVAKGMNLPAWDSVLLKVDGTSVGGVGLPASAAVVGEGLPSEARLGFSDGAEGWGL